jgi:hypothetical protein
MSQMSLTAAAARERAPVNGVDTRSLFATINVVRQQPDLAPFRFRASNRWLGGTHSRTRIESFSGAGGDQRHAAEFKDGSRIEAAIRRNSSGRNHDASV